MRTQPFSRVPCFLSVPCFTSTTDFIFDLLDSGWSLSCSFYDIVSDGKKYVWGAVSRGVPKIDVFDIDTGATVGSFETCRGPRDLEYHALRDEIWVRCMGTNSGEFHDDTATYMDVFSASSPGADIVTNVMMSDNSTFSSYGYSVIENSLGDIGYSTVWNDNHLYKIDLSAKKVLEKFEVPLAYGSYEVAYSAKNQHVFLRASVCCTCGFPGADAEECGRYGSSNVTITTGPFAGQVKPGQCGRCDGMQGVDTLGVYEFDTRSETFIANHLMPAGVGGDPFSSPDGRYIVLVGRNGGEKLRFLKTANNGQRSSVAFDLELGFDTTDEEDSAVFNDFAFIQSKSDEDDRIHRDMVVIASGTENKVALVDMKSGSPQKTIVNLSSNPELTARRNSRQVEWVRGTPFVWIDGTDTEEGEVYVINVDTKRVVRTITGIKTTKLINVENFERKHMMARMSEIFAAQLTQSQSVDTTTETDSRPTTSLNVGSTQLEEDDSDIDPVGVIALIVGLLGCVVGIANMVVLKKAMGGNSSHSNTQEEFKDDGHRSLGSSKMAV